MITFEGVTKRYADGTLAVDDLTLECADGEITVLVGSSGCGKTTSLRMINRLVEPTSGIIRVDGRDVRQADPAELRRGMGYVIQQGGLFPHRSVIDNIATVPRLIGRSRGQARRRAEELMALVGLTTEMAGRYPHQLSGGQQQRVGVARALAADPPVLLMDEPFSAVDPVVRAELQQELLRVQATLHKTIVFVTHDIDEAVRLGDRIAVMRVGGRLVQFDTPQNVLAAPADPFVAGFLGHDRGIRWLSFFPATALPLQAAETVRIGEAVRGRGWALVVDADRRPLGWWEGEPGSTVDAQKLRSVGPTFRRSTDSLRAVLDALVLAPSGKAVAVDEEGRVSGLVGHADMDGALRRAADGS